MGAFGLLDDHHHERIPAERFVGSRPCLDVHRLYREGFLTGGGSVRLEHGPEILLRSHVCIASPVFACPSCDRDCYKLFEVGGRWACYRCHGLTHASRHVNRTLPGWHRLMLLRRRIGASPMAFSPIEPRPRSHVRYWRIAAEIRQLEARLLSHLRHDVNDVIERRMKREHKQEKN